jgi:hypothetical protein
MFDWLCIALAESSTTFHKKRLFNPVKSLRRLFRLHSKKGTEDYGPSVRLRAKSATDMQEACINDERSDGGSLVTTVVISSESTHYSHTRYTDTSSICDIRVWAVGVRPSLCRNSGFRNSGMYPFLLNRSTSRLVIYHKWNPKLIFFYSIAIDALR